ncbi:hypothetical protein [Proteus mirabilis]|uniref:hypothetical protein n=1 Tax=Proteus mirabilis TaxID=584 RepID=UPI002577521C|nr:hypothetical protein [Proteus mirabilis]MDM3646312.1 hypothetical protein [Proteus mirabilis]
MGFKGTPAPWKYTVRNANEIMTTFHGVTIGDVYLDITTANQKSDAHLIATAPELLEQLIRLRNKIASYKPDDDDDLDIVDAVIAKALGQQ